MGHNLNSFTALSSYTESCGLGPQIKVWMQKAIFWVYQDHAFSWSKYFKCHLYYFFSYQNLQPCRLHAPSFSKVYGILKVKVINLLFCLSPPQGRTCQSYPMSLRSLMKGSLLRRERERKEPLFFNCSDYLNSSCVALFHFQLLRVLSSRSHQKNGLHRRIVQVHQAHPNISILMGKIQRETTTTFSRTQVLLLFKSSLYSTCSCDTFMKKTEQGNKMG